MRYPRKTSGAAIMNTITSARSTAMIGSPSVSRKRFRALSGTGMRAPLVQRDHPRGQVRETDLALRELAHHPSAIQDHEAVGYLVHVGEVVLDVDAGAAPRLDTLDERQHLAHPDVPRRRPEDAADDLDEGGLAGAVVAQQADDLVAAHGEVDVRERLHLAERHLHLLEADDVPEALGCGFHGRGLAHARHSSSERIRLLLSGSSWTARLT